MEATGYSAASQIWLTTSNCRGRVQSLHPNPHSSWSFVPRKEALESWAQVPLAAWLSSLCLEQGINLSPDRGKGKGG